jgi:hypothetical protein
MSVRRRLLGALVAVALAALPLAAVAVFRPGDRALALDVYLLFVGGVMLLALVQASRETERPDPFGPFARALVRRVTPRERLQQLARQEREVGLSVDAAFDLHVRLRPTLRLIAAHRLAAMRGIDLDRQPERARAVLGEDAWELVREDREAPLDRFARGIPVDRLRAVVESLERI